ncbi:shikimate dehydrogenase [Rhizobium ruizarguesonis]|jgi:shikimate dehydrogenase|uniref:shikimate dehydrogenase (NADP(+)) n=2 Tax=Rhizobium ruizarguesonis TaxID=2081791 RepID=A0AAE8Q3T9_9HYPH|nr:MULTISPECIES: shikimate dehydrogenase [Rhizobium]NEH87418.1 shikimate dehydrogenase [Rhizobium ruizarguesonis]NEI16396.1 shikimate dehydrogenase [Rhizobium ruizarguesonis]NEJ08617.1 shikimate dehydrogenase [Rhizobium ruizarguesonis]NEJ17025.1 shikimate dehydrogenase [Rhizobium ruizarguesonis]NEJ59453.1 shikimate dehydrogenase [Rhizobium ruizarguesonis]
MSIIEDPKILEITGRTRVLGILAHPTEHVKAPPGINRIAMMRGRDAVMVPLNVAPADLESFVASLRVLKSFDGAIVTVPHKQAIIRLCDEVSPQALAVGAANVLRRKPDGRLIGDQLDGIGFVEGLGDQDIAVSGRGVYLVGAGGAANAIAFALAEAGITRLTLANRTVEKIETLAAKLKGAYPALDVAIGTADPRGHDLVINGTTLGMNATDPLPLDASLLEQGMTVAEVIMEPEITPLLQAARETGCRIHLGRHMLDHQLQLMANFLGL